MKDNVINIDKQNKLFTIYPPSRAGRNGYDVFNKEIIASDGVPLKVEIGENIREVQVKNCKVYYSLIEGRFFYDKLKGFINVRKVMTVDNVDLDSGNINFKGDLYVRGDIVDNMEVVLEGDLIVKGNIGAANIFTKGDLKCDGGIVTRNKGRISCKGNILAKFMENSIVECYGDIRVLNAILNSEVKSNKSIVVKGEKGFIIGGNIYAKDSIKAVSIGSSHGNKTDIHLGNDFIINNNYSKISSKRIKLEDKYNKTTELITKLFKIKKDVSEFTDDMKAIYKKSLVVQVQLKEKIIELKSIEVKLLTEMNSMDRCELIVDEKLYCDVTLFFGEKSFIIKSDESLMQIITAKADTYANEVFDFYLTRVSEKVKDVNDASEIEIFELKNVYLGGRSYPETVIKVKTSSDAEAEISTTVETHFSNRGTFFLKFPTRFHNMKKSGNPVKSPSWNNFVELARECA